MPAWYLRFVFSIHNMVWICPFDLRNEDRTLFNDSFW